MRRLVNEGGPFFVLACVLLVGGVAFVIVGRSADSTATMGVGLALLLLAVAAIQLSVRRRNRRFEDDTTEIRDVIGEARARRGELLADDPDEH